MEESVFISPYVGELEFDWSGREVEIRFSELLKSNTTYVVNIGTDVVDVRNRNRMAQAFTLAFATGATIDRGVIGGTVYPAKEGEKPEGVMMFAYQIDGASSDTLDPRSLRPDYITQTGKDGTFLLTHLQMGRYRLFAVRDEFRNLLYDPEADDYGVLPYDIKLSESDSARRGLAMRLAKEDTTAPRLIKVVAKDQHHLIMEFSEPIDTATVALSGVTIRDTVTNTPLNVLSVSAMLPKRTEFFVVTEKQEADRAYRLTIAGFRDFSKLEIHPLASSLGFVGERAADTLAPVVATFSLKDSARGVELQPDILVSFGDAVAKEHRANVAQLSDSSGNIVPIEARWLNDISLLVTPVRKLASKMWFTLSVDERKLRDLQGNGGRDTTRTLRFLTLDGDALSSIEGAVADAARSDTIGGILIRARQALAKEPRVYEARLPKPGNFVIREMAEGKYILEAIRDRNGNQKFDAGVPFPFVPSERFTVLPDTLKLRARWPLDGVKIELK